LRQASVCMSGNRAGRDEADRRRASLYDVQNGGFGHGRRGSRRVRLFGSTWCPSTTRRRRARAPDCSGPSSQAPRPAFGDARHDPRSPSSPPRNSRVPRGGVWRSMSKNSLVFPNTYRLRFPAPPQLFHVLARVCQRLRQQSGPSSEGKATPRRGGSRGVGETSRLFAGLGGSRWGGPGPR
jgi:hypothetical protein